MEQPNILLIILDSVRAANTSLYGYSRETTPFLEEYSERATLYSQARSPGIHSVATHASIWTGKHVEQHQIIKHGDRLRSGTTIWEELSEQGYETGLFTENTIVAHTSNLSDFFNDVVTSGQYVDTSRKLFPEAFGPTDVKKHEGFIGNLKRSMLNDSTLESLLNCVHHIYLKQRETALDEMMESPELIDRFIDWQFDTESPWGACLNLMDAHYPYMPKNEYDLWGGEELKKSHSQLTQAQSKEFLSGRPWWQLGAFQSLYDGAIRQVDDYLRDLIRKLEQTEAHDDTMVVITSDHGEGFGEVSRLTGKTMLVDHSWGIHEVLTHVPLLVKFPNQMKPNVMEQLISLAVFPNLVQSVTSDTFNNKSIGLDIPVIASTYRLLEEDAKSFDNSRVNISEYQGPWRAVYQESDNAVRKFAKKGSESIVLEVLDAQYAYPIDRQEAGTVERTFSNLDDVSLKAKGGVTIDNELKNRLSDLGYLT